MREEALAAQRRNALDFLYVKRLFKNAGQHSGGK